MAITAGVLSHRGYFTHWHAIVAVAAGGWTTDLITYYGARYFRDHPRVLRALARPAAQRLTARFLTRPLLLTAIFRFIPGARFIVPVYIGTATGVRSARYLPITFCSAVVWATLLVTLGTKIGRALGYLWGHLWSPTGLLVVLGLAILGTAARDLWRYARSA
ncbi:VTT domain-containing protein [Roseivivax sediminis]|uniref:Membrane protein DedA, SNARE-associated domain n=1 Tax=Roseivivax sediminis TaxID=936889 RepID=A0A1I1SFV0_9RHOB|nr:VTT domain-containing protein [Roseivivax sediminis]SFD45349.1 membrane protein DedA, SNARE-associated domain [Roseivivax sediminis]